MGHAADALLAAVDFAHAARQDPAATDTLALIAIHRWPTRDDQRAVALPRVPRAASGATDHAVACTWTNLLRTALSQGAARSLMRAAKEAEAAPGGENPWFNSLLRHHVWRAALLAAAGGQPDDFFLDAVRR